MLKQSRAKKSNAQKWIMNINGECKSSSEHAKQLNKKAMELQSTLDFEHDCLSQRVEELESQIFATKEHRQKYLDNIRRHCMELLALKC